MRRLGQRLSLALSQVAELTEQIRTLAAGRFTPLTRELRRTVELRRRDVLALRAVLAEIEDRFGEPMVHHALAMPLELIEAKVLELYEGLRRRGERFPLPRARRRAHLPLSRLGAMG